MDKRDNFSKHNLANVDKSGFPISDKGNHVAIFDEEGNALLLLGSNLITKFEKGAAIKFNPTNVLEVRKALDDLVEILTKNFDKNISGNFEIDLSDEVKLAKNLRTAKPLVVATVQIYFCWIDNWLNYFTNCYNFEFKLRFYTKFKTKIKKNIIALETNLNNYDIKENYLDYAKKWISQTDDIIYLEQKSNPVRENLQDIANKSNEELKKVIRQDNEKPKNTYPEKELFQIREITIAYFFRKGIAITPQNYKEILAKHSIFTSKKILQKRVRNISELTTVHGNRTVDTKHLNNLKSAKRLLSVEKDTEAVKDITQVIAAFESNYNSYHY